MKTPYLFFILLFICFHTSAQVSFKKGYYLDHSNDTIFGLIKDYDWNDNPTQMTFKSNENTSEEILKPEDVLSFEIYDKVKYTSAKVDLDTSSDKIGKLSKKRLPEFKSQHIFLKVLEEGNVALYCFSNKINTRFFYKTSEQKKPELLIFKKYINSTNKMGENNNFRQQLLNSLPCENLPQSTFSNLKYKEKDLKKLISTYNACVGESTYSYEQDKSKQSIFIAIRPGLQLAALTTKSGSNDEIKFDTELSFRIGLEFEYILPFNNRKWSFVFEPTYQSYASRKEILVQDFLLTLREVNYSSIEIPVGIRYYMFLNPENQLFINAGIVYDIGIGNNQIRGNRDSGLDLEALLNPYFGIGYRYKEKLSVELRYQTKRDVLRKYATRSSNFSSTSFIIGYRLN